MLRYLQINRCISSVLLTGLLVSTSNWQLLYAQSQEPAPIRQLVPPSPEDEDLISTNQLPLPQHPERKPTNPDNSLPRPSQPNRESRKSVLTQARTTRNIVPGNPSRNLGKPSTIEEAQEEAAEPPSKEEEEAGAPGIFGDLIPHSFGKNGGLAFECIYTGETFTKARGGLTNRRPTNYRSNLDLVATADTGKLGLWDRGRLFVYGQNLSGNPLSASAVGDAQLFSNLDSTINDTERPHFTTIAEYWYEQYFSEDKLRIKIGKQDANADFALTDLGGEFVHSSFGLPPMIPLPTFPSQSLGLACFLRTTETLEFAVGLFDGVLPSGSSGVRWGFDSLGHNGMISLYQMTYKPQLGPEGQLPTTIRTGMWHHSDKTVWTELSSAPDARLFRQNYGCFTSIDQMLWKESYSGDDDQGIGAFFQYGYAPGNRNFLQNYFGGGFVYKGLLPNRDQDVSGIAFANVQFSSPFRQLQAEDNINIGPYETAVEMFYKCIVGPNFSLQPDLQYISHPGGQYKDALLPGLRFEAIF
jgi:porin